MMVSKVSAGIIASFFRRLTYWTQSIIKHFGNKTCCLSYECKFLAEKSHAKFETINIYLSTFMKLFLSSFISAFLPIGLLPINRRLRTSSFVHSPLFLSSFYFFLSAFHSYFLPAWNIVFYLFNCSFLNILPSFVLLSSLIFCSVRRFYFLFCTCLLPVCCTIPKLELTVIP
jgi:hypothetical protein